MQIIKTSPLAALALALALALSPAAPGGNEPQAPMVTAPDASCPWNVSVEYLNLKSYSSEEDTFDDTSHETGYRLSASYAFESDLAFRVTYFDYQGIQNNSDDNMNASAIDFELVCDLTLGSCQGNWSVGLRMAEYYERYDDNTNADYDGWGLTVGAELNRSLSSNFDIYVKARTSLIYGDDDYAGDLTDLTLMIHELGAGVQFDFSGWAGYDGNIRLGYENQIWSGPVDSDSEDAGLAGIGLRINVNF